MRAVFDRRKDHAVIGLDYMVEFSSNHTEWPPSSAIPEVIADERVLEKVGLPFPIQLHQQPFPLSSTLRMCLCLRLPRGLL